MGYSPTIFNVFKPSGVTSYDVIRHFKRNLPPGFGKIGHMGTLDPFAAGILLVAVGGATRVNDYVHRLLPKTYLAIGKLGVWTETGDLTIPVQQVDESAYLLNKIALFTPEFIQQQLQERFLGEYLQTPPIYSATKFQGKPLHEWKRKEGVEIKKEPVKRTIYQLEVVKYRFPYLTLRVTVSSGTYIRTLFEEVANTLGSIGSLLSLVREQIGGVNVKNSIHSGRWPVKGESYTPPYHCQFGQKVDQLLPFNQLNLDNLELVKYRNGNPVSSRSPVIKVDSMIDDNRPTELVWVYPSTDSDMDTANLGPIGLGEIEASGSVRPIINFA
jgi:tRNA pseudouridine55 synthase